MSMEKLRKAMQLIQECIDEYQGEETDEGDTSSDDSYGDQSDTGDSNPNDKVKMAATLMRRSSK